MFVGLSHPRNYKTLHLTGYTLSSIDYLSRKEGVSVSWNTQILLLTYSTVFINMDMNKGLSPVESLCRRIIERKERVM